jgi:hypothetical protein
MRTRTVRPSAFQSDYSWIPSIFTVSENENDVTIGRYINGLGPRDRNLGLISRYRESVSFCASTHPEDPRSQA